MIPLHLRDRSSASVHLTSLQPQWALVTIDDGPLDPRVALSSLTCQYTIFAMSSAVLRLAFLLVLFNLTSRDARYGLRNTPSRPEAEPRRVGRRLHHVGLQLPPALRKSGESFADLLEAEITIFSTKQDTLGVLTRAQAAEVNRERRGMDNYGRKARLRGRQKAGDVRKDFSPGYQEL